eukprot:s3471_g2.t1
MWSLQGLELRHLLPKQEGRLPDFFFDGADGILLPFSLHYSSSFDQALASMRYIDSLEIDADALEPEKIQRVLLGTHLHMHGKSREVTSREALQVAHSRGYSYHEVFSNSLRSMEDIVFSLLDVNLDRMDDTLRDVLALRDRKAVYEAFVSRCIRMLHSHKAGACWDSLRLVMIESSTSRALMKSQGLLHRTKRKFNKALSLVLGRSEKVAPMVQKEEWHESGGVRIVEGFLSGSWSSRVCSLAPAVHPWLKAVQSRYLVGHAAFGFWDCVVRIRRCLGILGRCLVRMEGSLFEGCSEQTRVKEVVNMVKKRIKLMISMNHMPDPPAAPALRAAANTTRLPATRDGPRSTRPRRPARNASFGPKDAETWGKTQAADRLPNEWAVSGVDWPPVHHLDTFANCFNDALALRIQKEAEDEAFACALEARHALGRGKPLIESEDEIPEGEGEEEEEEEEEEDLSTEAYNRMMYKRALLQRRSHMGHLRDVQMMMKPAESKASTAPQRVIGAKPQFHHFRRLMRGLCHCYVRLRRWAELDNLIEEAMPYFGHPVGSLRPSSQKFKTPAMEDEIFATANPEPSNPPAFQGQDHFPKARKLLELVRDIEPKRRSLACAFRSIRFLQEQVQSGAHGLTVADKDVLLTNALIALKEHSSRTMLMYLKLVTAGAVNALFYQGSALSTNTESEECREPETPFLQAMRAFAIGIFSALVGDLLILILWKVQKRPSVISEPWSEEVQERTLQRWKRRLRGFWWVSLGHCFFCLFYIFTFLANVTEEDSSKWLVATLVSLVEDLLMLPITLAVSFGSVASLLLFFRPDVKADIRARWIDEDTGTISQMVVFKPSKKSVYILENEDDLEAAPDITPPPLSENIRVESVGPSANQGPFFGVAPTRPDGCEAEAVAADSDVLT